MAAFEELERHPHGAVKETEEFTSRVPLPRRQRERPLVVPPSPQSGGAPEPNLDYELDAKATNAFASMPPDVQEKAHRAQVWYEIAAHPGATDFEIALANAHMDEMEPDELKEKRLAEEEATRKEAQTKKETKTTGSK